MLVRLLTMLAWEKEKQAERGSNLIGGLSITGIVDWWVS